MNSAGRPRFVVMNEHDLNLNELPSLSLSLSFLYQSQNISKKTNDAFTIMVLLWNWA